MYLPFPHGGGICIWEQEDLRANSKLEIGQEYMLVPCLHNKGPEMVFTLNLWAYMEHSPAI